MSDTGTPRERRLVFGEVAELYERVRPSYPPALIDDIFAFADLSGGARLLESGAGTGKATRLVLPYLVPNGWRLTLVEPDPHMAAILSGHAAGELGSGRIELHVTGLEQFAASAPEGGFDLLYAAQSWHWVSAERRATLATRLLQAGGTLALVWNVGSQPEEGLRERLDEVYARHAPGIRFRPVQSGATSTRQPLRELGREYGAELEATGAFSPLEVVQREWSATYDTATWTTLLQTHSDHRLLEPDALARLLEAVAEVVDGLGGSIVCHYRAVALLARRRA